MRHLGDRRALVVAAWHEVEGDVDRAGPRGDRGGVLVDGLLVERIEDRDLGAAARVRDVRGDALQRLRPARCMVAPSRANVRATAPPSEPPAP